ncbi:glutamate ABC transporter substrate-binding protein [Corynebacterium lubricantis]|uniref:glutamate ABC transporter substrate-binding protein n=1 Tax=Corynebacterium lubricantis TaxID=541095 RepID=UPI0003818593|nr:glutamate ABC transporter substrate-binding protein [Corynebacterium lubricantis]
MRKLMAVIALMLAAAMGLAACGTPTNRYAVSEPPPLYRAGPPLPNGAIREPADAHQAQSLAEREPLGSLAPTGDSPEELVPDLVKRGRIIVGVDQAQHLLSFRNPINGNLEGFEIELAREIAQDVLGSTAHVDFRFVDANDRADALNQGRVDMVIRTMSISRDRQNSVSFSTPYLESNLRMLVPRGSNVRSMDTLGHGTVCVANGSTAVDVARLEAPDSTLLLTESWADCLLALQQFHADAVLADDTILSGMAAQDPSTEMVSLPLYRQQYGVAVKLGNDNLVRQINSTMERIRRDGTWWRIYNDWLADYLATSGPPPLNYREEEPSTEPSAEGN